MIDINDEPTTAPPPTSIAQARYGDLPPVPELDGPQIIIIQGREFIIERVNVWDLANWRQQHNLRHRKTFQDVDGIDGPLAYYSREDDHA